MAGEREVVACTKSSILGCLRCLFPHSAAAKLRTNHFFAAFHLQKGWIGMKKLFSPRVLAACAALIATNIILTKLLSITLVYVRISFNFLPIFLGAMLYGPWVGGITALLADILGVIIVGEPLFWGYSVSAFLYGATYGAFLCKREITNTNLIACIALQTIFIDILLGALWANMFFGKPYFVALLGRSLDAVPMAIVKVYMIKYIWKLAGARLQTMIKG